MGIAYNPKIVTDGLVLALDAANQKSFGPISVEYLIVAGGGGGGMDMGGGGGGGGVIIGTASISSAQSHTVTVGPGGWGAPAGGGGFRGDGAGPQPNFHQFTIPATAGGNSSAFGVTAIGGGIGGSSFYGHQLGGTPTGGGSGGGAGGYSSGSSVFKAGGAGTPGQGHNGGRGGPQYYSGGGGGAGAPGVDSTAVPHGGAGVASGILGTLYFWGGGGGGAAYSVSPGGNGGLGGGGGGAVGTTTGGTGLTNGSPGGGGSPNSQTNTPGGNGGTNTGGGGGGGAHYRLTNQGGNGGSGIVVIRYAGAQKATGGTITTVGSDTVHTFTSSGTFTTGTNWADLSGSGNTGTLVNGAAYNSNNDGSLVFDGTDDYVNLGSIFTYTNFTISLWANPGASQVQYADIFDNNHTGTRNFVCQQDNLNTNQYQFACLNAVNSSVTSVFTLAANTWVFLTFTWNNSVASVYINGVLHSSGSAANPINYESPNLIIGAWSQGGRNWNGRISNFYTYNSVFTPQEVQQNFNALKSRYFGYQSVTYTATANMTLTNNGTQDVTMFKNTNNNSWNGEVRSTESFSAPCTIEFSKQSGTTDNGASYLMIGWNEDPTTNTSYTSIDHASYPYQQNSYVVYNNGGSAIVLGPWDQNKRFYIVYDTDGFIRHYNGSTLLYSANYGTNKTVFVDSSFYSVNSTFGGLTNVKVAKSSWNGFSYV